HARARRDAHGRPGRPPALRRAALPRDHARARPPGRAGPLRAGARGDPGRARPVADVPRARQRAPRVRDGDEDGRRPPALRRGAGGGDENMTGDATGQQGIRVREPLIFEKSRPGRRATAQAPAAAAEHALPAAFLRDDTPVPREVSGLQVVRHFTRLSQEIFSIDTHFCPRGSCTMKYNPRACNTLAMLPGFLDRHPLAPPEFGQGFLACMYELQEMLKAVTGMKAV